MNRSLPLAESSVCPRLFSPPGGGAILASTTGHTSLATRHFAGFTLIELLVVMAVVAILAGLTLGGLGFVNRKGAASRAQTEVAALSAAIESYKLDYGSYPASNNLYAELTAQEGAVNTNKVYFEPISGMVKTNVAPRVFQDPYGMPYNYNPENPARNVGFFDLWCVPPDARSEADWIHN